MQSLGSYAQHGRGLESSLSHSALKSLFVALHAKEQLTLPHSLRATSTAEALGRAMGLAPVQMQALYIGGLLHDVGKISLPNGLLMKPSTLNPADWTLLRRHPEAGCRMLAHYGLSPEALGVVRSHHERYDGLGYPDGLHGKEIPLLARIFALADSLDAMLSARPYRDGCSEQHARREIQHGAGRQFDPEVVDAFQAMDAAELECFKPGQKEMAGRNYRISYWY